MASTFGRRSRAPIATASLGWAERLATIAARPCPSVSTHRPSRAPIATQANSTWRAAAY